MDIRAATSGIALKCTSETPCLNSQHSEPSTAAQGLFLKPGEVVLFGKDSSCPLPLHEGISQLQPGVWLARGGSQVIQHGHCHLCGQRWQEECSCCFSFPFILFSESLSLFPLFYFPSALMKAGFPLLSPVEAIQPAKRKLCLALRLRVVVRVACAERAGG